MRLIAYCIGSILFADRVFANRLIPSNEANQFFKSRNKRFISYFTSDVKLECFLKDVCDSFEEFAEGAEKIYGKSLIRENLETQMVFEKVYLECHNDADSCKSCKGGTQKTKD